MQDYEMLCYSFTKKLVLLRYGCQQDLLSQLTY